MDRWMPPLPLPACFLLGGCGGGATTAYQFKRLGPRRSVGRAPTPEEEMEEEEEEEEDKEGRRPQQQQQQQPRQHTGRTIVAPGVTI